MTSKNETQASPFAKALDITAKIAELRQEAYRYWIGTDHLIDTYALCLTMGHHAMVFGVPGTAKSDIIGTMSKAIGLGYYFTQGGPDLGFDEIVGPVKMSAIKNDSWDRVWQNMATSEIVFFDEFGKAPTEVVNLTLSLMEERIARARGAGQPVPLHSLFAATNEYDFIFDAPAAFDRFLFRLKVDTLNKQEDIAALLDTPTLRDENGKVRLNVSGKITAEDLIHVRQATHLLTKHAPQQVKKAIIEIWQTLKSEFDDDIFLSNRRLLNYQRAAASHALLSGRDFMGLTDLAVGKYVLWSDPDQQDKVAEIVDKIANQGAESLVSAEKAVQKLRRQLADVEAAWSNADVDRSDCAGRHGTLLSRIDVTKTFIAKAKGDTPEHYNELHALLAQIETIENRAEDVMRLYKDGVTV